MFGIGRTGPLNERIAELEDKVSELKSQLSISQRSGVVRLRVIDDITRIIRAYTDDGPSNAAARQAATLQQSQGGIPLSGYYNIFPGARP